MTRTELAALLAANITDNTAGENTAARVREVITELINSNANITDNPNGWNFYTEVEVTSSDILSLGTVGVNLLPGVFNRYYDAMVIIEFSAGDIGYTFDNDFLVVDLNGAYTGVINSSSIIGGNTVTILKDFSLNSPGAGYVRRDPSATTGSLRLTTYNSTDPTDGDGTIRAKIWYNQRRFGTEM